MAHGEVQIGPQEAVDRIEIGDRIDHIRMIDVHEERCSGHEAQPFVEALVLRTEFFGPAQMPFAEEQGAVALIVQ